MRALILTLWLALMPCVVYGQASIIVQQSPLAGFQYYDGKARVGTR